MRLLSPVDPFTIGGDGDRDDCSTAPPPGDPALLAEGWRRRMRVDPDRAAEMADLYRELGHEVKVVPVPPASFAGACGDCGVQAGQTQQDVYTR